MLSSGAAAELMCCRLGARDVKILVYDGFCSTQHFDWNCKSDTSTSDDRCISPAGSGSTIVCMGSDQPPAFLQEPGYADMFVAPARLIARPKGEWYQPSLKHASVAVAA